MILAGSMSREVWCSETERLGRWCLRSLILRSVAAADDAAAVPASAATNGVVAATTGAVIAVALADRSSWRGACGSRTTRRSSA